MKGILLLNGQPYLGKIDDTSAQVWCCDGAYNWSKGRLRIDKNIGDFDSCEGTPYPLPEEIYPTEKAFTDGEIAVKKMIESGIDDILIYGGGGGREDHFLGNIHLLYKAISLGAKCVMVNNHSFLFMGTGRVQILAEAGTTVSVLPFKGDAHIMGSAGLKYAYPDTLCYGECRGISNVVEDANAYVEVKGGDYVLVIINGSSV